MLDFIWREPEQPTPRFRTSFDFGVRRVDTAHVINTSVIEDPIFMWNGIPVEISEFATQQVIKRKHWKRRGRPDKVRTRCFDAPSAIFFDKAKLESLGHGITKPFLFIHPKLKHLLKDTE